MTDRPKDDAAPVGVERTDAEATANALPVEEARKRERRSREMPWYTGDVEVEVGEAGGARRADAEGDAGPGSWFESVEDAAQADRGAPTAELPMSAESVPWYDGTVVELDGDEQAHAPSVAQLEELPNPGPARPWLVRAGKLAQGGMGRIERVFDRELRRMAAMKVLRRDRTDDGAAQRRFREEAQITGQLDHPNIPPVYDLWVDEDGIVRFTMKLVRGKTLWQVLTTRPPMDRSDRDWEKLLGVFVKVCDAVSFAHQHGVIHRDLKADNVMVGSHGQVWVMDWGCALLLPRATGPGISVDRDPATESIDPPETAIGTPAQMAPEQALGQTHLIDELTDVYLLGGLLFQMLTNQPPHPAPDALDAILRAQRGEVDDPHVAAGGQLPPELCRIALRALSAPRSHRFPSVDALKAAVEEAIRSGWWFTSASFAPGTLIVREGDRADAAYIITEGQCEAFRIEDGERVLLRRMGPGETFGETAIFADQTRTASVEAVARTAATLITRDAFERAMQCSWLRPFVRALVDRFREADARLSSRRGSDGRPGGPAAE